MWTYRKRLHIEFYFLNVKWSLITWAVVSGVVSAISAERGWLHSGGLSVGD